MASPHGPQAGQGPLLHYADADGAAALLARIGDEVIGVIGYGAGRPPGLKPGIPFLSPPLGPAGGPAQYEIWQDAGPAEILHSGAVTAAFGAAHGFAAIRLDDRLPMEQAAEQGYRAIFGALEAVKFPVPLRFWNYLSRILDEEDGMERYRRFNLGRHRAFLDQLTAPVPPAASCVGGRGDGSAVYVLTGREGARPIENPRQVSAYDYPAQYGPRSPSFSRAGLYGESLFISGTASITGHSSRHAGDVPAQLGETLANLRAVTRAAGFDPDFAADTGWALKIYLRAASERALVTPVLDAAFGPCPKLFLLGEVCRAELLLEIEAYRRG